MLISLYVSILLLTTSIGNHYELLGIDDGGEQQLGRARYSQAIGGKLFSFANCQTTSPGGRQQLKELSIADTRCSASGPPGSCHFPDQRCLAEGDDEANRYHYDKNCRFETSETSNSSRDTEPGTTCSSTQGEGWKRYVSRVPQSGNFLLVNTIDGRIHAFLLKCDNVLKYKWTFVLDEKQFEHNLNSLDFGEKILIPSLSGNLYSFDGKSLFQVHLPNNQPQMNLDVSFSGGSTVNLYGIDFLSGEVVYKCVNGECSTKNNSKQSQGTLVIKQEKFKYTYINSFTGESHIQVKVSDLDVNTFFSNSNLIVQDLLPLDSLRVQISDGILNMVDENNYVTFQYAFNAPIVNIWQISSNSVQTIPLFTSPLNPSIDKSLSTKSHFKYIGYFEKSMYIKESIDSGKQQSKNILFNKDYHSPFYEFLNDVKSYHRDCTPDCSATLRSNKSGFYIGFNGEKSSSPTIQYPQIGHELQIPIKNSKKDTLLSFWKEIFLICAVTSIIFHISICRIKNRQSNPLHNQFDGQFFQDSNSFNNLVSNQRSHDTTDMNISNGNVEDYNQNDCNLLKNINSEDNCFNSRFFNDFTYISMLGRGGFGHVYKCKHVIDNKDYAIKQINLPYRKISQDKIFREVHALANLEHRNILRYYHSWVENPPKSWYICKARNVFVHDASESFHTEDIEALFEPSVKLMQSFKSENNNEENINANSEHSDGLVEFVDTSPKSSPNTNKDINYDSRDIIPSSVLTASNQNMKTKELNRLQHLKEKSESDPNKFSILYIQVELCINKSLDFWLMMDSEDLFKKYPHNPLKNREKKHTLEVFQQLADAIYYVHQQGLMHRDLKPANIFFNKDNVLKLGDFGLVAFKFGATSNLSKDAIQKLASNTPISTDVGTLLYMSPEILNAKCYSQKVDIYSMAIILFELLENISTQNERIDKLYKLKSMQFPPNFQENHPKLCHFIKCMMVSNPKKRWNASKVLTSLDQYLKDL